MYIVIDGIDGSGKSTVLNAWIDYLIQSNNKIFNLKKYWQEHKIHPDLNEINTCDILISAEPTTVWTGAAIRQEMIKNGSQYSADSIADAYALDRLVLLKRLIVPFRRQGGIIVQDRGVSTSLCYQSIQSPTTLPMRYVSRIEGNAFALENAPDHLVIADLQAEQAMNRLSQRSDEQDDAIFEKLDFLKKARQKYLDPDFQKYFAKRGTRIHVLDCGKKIDIMKQSGVKLLKSILS